MPNLTKHCVCARKWRFGRLQDRQKTIDFGARKALSNKVHPRSPTKRLRTCQSRLLSAPDGPPALDRRLRGGPEVPPRRSRGAPGRSREGPGRVPRRSGTPPKGGTRKVRVHFGAPRWPDACFGRFWVDFCSPRRPFETVFGSISAIQHGPIKPAHATWIVDLPSTNLQQQRYCIDCLAIALPPLLYSRRF